MNQPKLVEMSWNTMKSLFIRIGKVGSSSNDNDEVKLHKTLLVAFASIMAVLALIWGCIYFYFGEFLAGSIPMSYALISMASLAVFSRLKSYSFFRVSQLFFSLLLPFLLMICLGGYAASSAVVIWSLISPLGALVFKGRAEATKWFIAYLGLIVLGVFLEGSYHYSNNLPEKVKLTFFAMNISGFSLTAFVLMRYFVGEKNLSLTLLESRNKWIKEAFSAYISPNLVNHLLRNPSELKLGGERRECTFVFTDLVVLSHLWKNQTPLPW